MPQVLIEVPEILHDALQDYLKANSHRTIDEALAMGLCVFLMQNFDGDRTSDNARKLAREYLTLLLKKPEL